MMDKNELVSVVGGIKYGIVGILAGIAVFIIGIIDGYQRPVGCDDE